MHQKKSIQSLLAVNILKCLCVPLHHFFSYLPKINDYYNSISPNKKIGEFCNLNRQGIIYSKGRQMLLVYVGNHVKVGNGRGFHATFRAISKKKVPHFSFSKLTLKTILLSTFDDIHRQNFRSIFFYISSQ